jgi:transcriptional regulator with XRE-family HTH domain
MEGGDRMLEVGTRYMARRAYAERLRRRRRELDLTQADIAGILGVSVGLVSAWERRATLTPIRFVRTLERVLGMAPGELLELWARANQERSGEVVPS